MVGRWNAAQLPAMMIGMLFFNIRKSISKVRQFARYPSVFPYRLSVDIRGMYMDCKPVNKNKVDNQNN